jgi:glyoxylase-like metal-dependent hydrolase (beta-lactamase superfamily II)
VAGLVITPITVGGFAENAYLLVDSGTARAIFVDPGAEGDRLTAAVQAAGATLEAIWLTHAHVDHVGGIAALRRAFPGVPIHLHPLDRPLYDRAAATAAAYGLTGFEGPPDPDRDLSEGQVLMLGEARFEVLHVPGHAPGHVLFVGREAVFGGDLLFAGSIGRTDLPFSNPTHMAASLGRAANLPAHLAVYPGHGPPTTIGAELTGNPYLRLSRPTAVAQ